MTLINNTTSSQPAMDRLLLLVAAIAQNPGIASEAAAARQATTTTALLIEGMDQVAQGQKIEFVRPSEHTIKKDLATLRRYGILPSGTALRSGYYLGIQAKYKPVERVKKPRTTKSQLSIEEIRQLREDGLTMQAIADLAELSKARIGQILDS